MWHLLALPSKNIPVDCDVSEKCYLLKMTWDSASDGDANFQEKTLNYATREHTLNKT